MLLHIFGITS